MSKATEALEVLAMKAGLYDEEQELIRDVAELVRAAQAYVDDRSTLRTRSDFERFNVMEAALDKVQAHGGEG